MKTGLFAVAAISLLQFAACQPRARGHQHLHQARQAVVEDVVTDTVVVTVRGSNVMVYVDGNGNPVSTEYQGQASPTAVPQSSSQSSTSTNPVAQSSSGSSSGSQGPGFKSAIAYSPYNADSSCKSSQQVAQDFQGIPSSYEVVRIYGTDCNQVANVLAAAKPKGMQLFVGIFDITQVASSVQIISSAVNGDWSAINTVNVGNELINDGSASVSQVVAAVGQARTALRTAGYNGPVVTVDTMVAMVANIELCTASDYCAINCHAFFDGGVAASGAGPFVLGWSQRVSAAAGGKTTVITETGWPTNGLTNGAAVPGTAQQQQALASLKSSFSDNMILFTAYNDLWETNTASQFDTEQYWGIYGDTPS
ncbi:hypothetical protein MMC08_004538 [Hypocenomyce scalaris]|nr:hypothetical protein [Hypocenomyce scalaris]